jgi:hypothetical protein
VRPSRRGSSFRKHCTPCGRISATVGLAPTRRNRFGALDSAVSRPNLLRSSGPRPLNAGTFLGLGFGSTPNLLRSLGLKAQLRIVLVWIIDEFGLLPLRNRAVTLATTGTSPTESDGAGCVVLISNLLCSHFRRVYLGGARNWKLLALLYSCRIASEGEKFAGTACCD